MRYYLIGMPGCGKSTWGLRLSKRKNLDFIDLDRQIEAMANMTIPEIFERKGESEFRLLEQQALKDTLKSDHAVIATGGGAPCFFNNMEWMRKHGTTIFINPGPGKFRERELESGRPLLREFSMQQLWEKRKKHYQKAHFSVETFEELDRLPVFNQNL